MEDLVRFLFFAYKYHHTPHNTSLNNHLSLSSLPTVPHLSLSIFKPSNSCSSCSSLFLATFKWCEDSRVISRCSLVIQASHHLHTRISTLALC
ncbi:hypothetical protein HanRHA438_Chr03g0112071 [Helianthus annuus]|nr:hypothetical protein HanRHA438_Chr03g0112071 [Helianthus annuus]